MNKTRYNLIDAIRGFSVINMVLYHLCYDIFVIFGNNGLWYLSPYVLAWEKFISISFILISGVALNFSTHPFRHGAVINVLGLIITAVTLIFLPSEAIWFGVLNFIGCAMLLGGALRKLFDRLNPFIGFFASVLLYAVFYSVTQGYVGLVELKLVKIPDFMYQTQLLTILGFPPSDFVSSDYFPILPWIFIFFAGYFLWKIIAKIKADRFFTRKIPLLCPIGRYSLWIYLIHQPICYGIIWLIYNIK